MKRSKKLFIFLIGILLAATAALAIYKHFNENSLSKVPNAPNSITDDNSSSSYYKDLYGTWTVTRHVPSSIKTTLSDSIISLCIGQKFTIEENKISSLFITISDPVIKEGTITASDFSNKYKDTFKNLGIAGNELKYVNVSEKDKSDHSATIFISSDGKTYALLSGAFFELQRS
ncbi:hypothetical protein CDLVIII_4105 [Clostridium sp. DL-VIII]|uniref:hypothetical protein n=1 Tax=Clostridium sp. DL-VIII TaxID=641107 RepID=UPI00023AFA2E|nr:hypothetical protein [Clostridium sp. DL-VIII]EHJ00638.1 hypothetical protein CDLVIII_4105 [Clostridium sp. DL-VIII]